MPPKPESSTAYRTPTVNDEDDDDDLDDLDGESAEGFFGLALDLLAFLSSA